MCEELTKEIENAKTLGRSERRKKERELQKKYNDGSIRILSNKTFTKGEALKRKERRNLIKDKNLLKELIKIINKYFPILNNLLDKLTDKRHKSYVTYNMRTLILTRIFALLCGITSMNEMNVHLNTNEAIKNLSRICNQNLNETPDWQTIQDVIEQLDMKEIRNIRKYMVKALIRSKMFDKYRYNGAFQLIVDATGISCHDYNLNNNCIIKKSKNGIIKYYKQVLEAKIVVGSIVISLDTEWIENVDMKTEKEKQDCEINTFKRMASRIKKEYPKLKFIITGDALYATAPMLDICKYNGWNYIFNLKKKRLKQVYEEFEDDIKFANNTNKNNYFLSCGIRYKNHIFNVIRYEEKQLSKEKEQIITFNYITDLKVNDYKIEDIVVMGRKRWKIENEGFNEQKNGTFCISHLCSRNENALKVHYYFIQIAHIIRQLLDNGSIILRGMKIKTKKEVSSQILKMLTSNQLNLNEVESNFQLRFTT